MTDVHDRLRRNGLVRPTSGRVLAGVCSGLGQRFGISPRAARLLFVLVLLVLPGSQLIVYPLLWLLMPAERPVTFAAAPTTASSHPFARSRSAG